MKMKQRFMLKALIAGALSLSALIGLSPKAAAVYADGATVDLSAITTHYVAQDGDVLTGTLPDSKHYKISIADGATVTLQDASITVANDYDYDWDGITLQGDANIILKGANTIASNRSRRSGIFVPQNKTVTIDGEGSLKVSGNGSAIGASNKKAGGNVTIKGGTIVARAGSSHAAIGGGYQNAPVGNITIEGGNIDARGGSYAPAIGCGETGSCGNITITGGTVTATGGDRAAGIGVGKFRDEVAGDILIKGGTVIAQGGTTAAGIGTGGDGTSKVGNITIENTVDEVVAKKGGTDNWGHKALCSIGAGYSGSNDPKARVGTVTVLGQVYPNGGVTEDTFAWPTFYSVTLNTNGGTIQEGDITRYKDGAGATLPTNVTKDFYIFKGWYDNEECTGEPITEIPADSTGDKVFWAKWELNPIIDLSTLKGNYKAQDGQTLTGTLSGNYKITVAAGASVTLKDATLKSVSDGGYNWAGISLEGDGTIRLEGKNFAKGFSAHYPGVFVPQGKTLTIEGDGSLEAQGNSTGAGIGGGWTVSCGNIVINHGHIIAKGNRAAAGIGGGQNGNCGNITIATTIGSLQVTGDGPYSIGPGNGASCGTVTVDGEVTGPIAQKNYVIYDVTAEQVLAAINGIGEVTATDKCGEDIKNARENYNKLRGSEKKKIDEATLKILDDAEVAYKEAVDTAKANAVIDAINNLPAVGDLALSDKASVTAARTAYNKLTAEQKAKVPADVLAKLTQAETEITNIEKATAVINTINKLPAIEKITLSNRNAVASARKAYNALTEYQKSKVPADLVAKLEAAESAIRVLDCKDKITKLPNAEGITLSNKAALEAARKAYDALTAEEKAQIDPDLLTKLEAAEQAFADLAITDLVNKINNFPSPEDITLANKSAVAAARATYEAFSDEEKAKVSPDTVAKLEAAESAIRVLEASDKIDKLPATEKVTLASESAIVAARAAYEALSDEEKAKVDSDLLTKLEAAEAALSDARVANVANKIENLPAADDVTIADKQTIEAARASYEALSEEEKAKVDPDLLAKLEAAEEALSNAKVELLALAITDLPAVDDITTADKEAIEAARAAYEALSDEEKKELDPTLLAKLEAAEIALAEAIVTEELGKLPDSLDDITTADQKAIETALAAYEALSEEQQASFDPELLAKLEAAEVALNKAIVVEEVAKFPETFDNLTPADIEAIEKALDAYEALPAEEKAGLDPEIVEKLKAAESALKVLEASEAIDNLPAADDITIEDKEAIEAARDAYEALTDEEKAKVDPELAAKLEAAVSALKVIEASEAIDNLPAADEITIADKEAIEAAREAYEALSEEEKAKVDAETLAKLEAAESALRIVEATDAISSLPEVDDITSEDKEAIEAAAAAYEALSEEEKAELDPALAAALEEAIDTLAAVEVSDAIEALPADSSIAASDKEAIEAARTAYDSLTADQKAKVSQEDLAKLVSAENHLAAAETKTLIDAIGQVDGSEASKAKIDAARAAYDALTAEQKALVSSDVLAKLEAAESTYATLTAPVSGGVIAGIVVCSVAILAGLFFLFFLLAKTRKLQKKQTVATSAVFALPVLALSAAMIGSIVLYVLLGVLAVIVIVDLVLLNRYRVKKKEAAEAAEKEAKEAKAAEEARRRAEIRAEKRAAALRRKNFVLRPRPNVKLRRKEEVPSGI